MAVFHLNNTSTSKTCYCSTRESLFFIKGLKLVKNVTSNMILTMTFTIKLVISDLNYKRTNKPSFSKGGGEFEYPNI